MSDEIILNLSFDNQTVTDLTGKWTLDGTPNATYEQIEGRDGYSIVEGSLGRCIVLNAVDQSARYDEYTVDFDMFVKSTYTSDYYFYKVQLLWSRLNPKIVGQYEGEIGEVLSITPRIGGSEPTGVTHYSPIGRWVHVTITSGPTGEDYMYHTAMYVDGAKLVERTDSGTAYDGNPFGLSQRIIPCARDPGSFLMPNGPGVCLNTFKIVAGIHAPDQEPAISLPNLSRVFQNFCTWLSSQLSAVAKSGSYNDLSDKPTISTVNDGTLTIQKNGTNVATFTANQSTAATANITVPTAVSELTNDSGYLTSSSNLDASKLTSGTVDIERLPQGALERLVKVANEAARYALTTADVQLGDTVQQLDTGIMYVVTDTDHLDSAAGYTEYTAGTAASVPWSGVTGKPTFAAVATSGAYSDLTGTPTIPTVNDATLTIQRNGTTIDTFTANSSSDKTVNISVPTKTSDLNNDSGFITGVSWNGVSDKPTFATVATSGSYNDLSNKPTIPTVNNATLTIQRNGTTIDTFTANSSSDKTVNISVPTKTSDLSNDSGYITGVTWNDVTNKPSFATVATSGSYNDLTNKPTIPTVNNATLTIQKNGTTVGTFTANSSTDKTVNISVPTKTSDLTNDNAYVNSLNNYISFSWDTPVSGKLNIKVDNTWVGGILTTANTTIPSKTSDLSNNSGFITADYAVPRSGGAVITGGKLGRTVTNGELLLCGGTDLSNGSFISLHGQNFNDGANEIGIGAGSQQMRMYPSGTWTWTGTAVQLISDQRYKQQITEIDDKLLDAWQDVDLVQFKYNDAVDQKGDKARLHTGYVVQQIDEACKSHGVDISEYGLYCHEEYHEETEEVEVEQEDGTKTKEKKVIREASEHYSLRYTEVYAVECMYLRRCIKQLTSRIEQLTARIEQLEKGKEPEAGK